MSTRNGRLDHRAAKSLPIICDIEQRQQGNPQQDGCDESTRRRRHQQRDGKDKQCPNRTRYGKSQRRQQNCCGADRTGSDACHDQGQTLLHKHRQTGDQQD